MSSARIAELPERRRTKNRITVLSRVTVCFFIMIPKRIRFRRGCKRVAYVLKEGMTS